MSQRKKEISEKRKGEIREEIELSTIHGMNLEYPYLDNNDHIIKRREEPKPVFNIDEDKYSEMNHMKSKAIQFLSFITQVSTLEEKNMEEEKDFINDKELVELINKIIVLIVKTFEDILNNKEKYFFLRKYKEDMKEEDDSYNILLFQICVFLTRCLVREPIKTEFRCI